MNAGALSFWQKISENLKWLPLLKLGFIPLTMTCLPSLTIHNEKVHLVIRPNISQLGLIKPDQRAHTNQYHLSDTGNRINERDLRIVWLDLRIKKLHIEKLNISVSQFDHEIICASENPSSFDQVDHFRLWYSHIKLQQLVCRMHIVQCTLVNSGLYIYFLLYSNTATTTIFTLSQSFCNLLLYTVFVSQKLSNIRFNLSSEFECL